MLDEDREVDEKCEMIGAAAKLVKCGDEGGADLLRKPRERHRNLANVFDKFDGEVNEAHAGLTRAVIASIWVTSWSCGVGTGLTITGVT